MDSTRGCWWVRCGLDAGFVCGCCCCLAEAGAAATRRDGVVVGPVAVMRVRSSCLIICLPASTMDSFISSLSSCILPSACAFSNISSNSKNNSFVAVSSETPLLRYFVLEEQHFSAISMIASCRLDPDNGVVLLLLLSARWLLSLYDDRCWRSRSRSLS